LVAVWAAAWAVERVPAGWDEPSLLRWLRVVAEHPLRVGFALWLGALGLGAGQNGDRTDMEVVSADTSG
jgi:hypothetical protein